MLECNLMLYIVQKTLIPFTHQSKRESHTSAYTRMFQWLAPIPPMPPLAPPLVPMSVPLSARAWVPPLVPKYDLHLANFVEILMFKPVTAKT